MSTRLAIIDLDGVVADNTARFAHAEEIKQAFLFPDGKDATSAYWQAASDPEYVSLDTLIEGAAEAIVLIEEQGYHILFLTSRPESMRQATVDWFWALSPQIVLLSDEWHDQLIMKAPAFQYVKTVTWKVGMIQTLAALCEAEKVLVIDDEEANINELRKHVPFPRGEQVNWCESLAQAVEAL